MKRALEIAAALAAIAAAAWGIARFAVAPLAASRVVQRVEIRTVDLYKSHNPVYYAPLIRDHITLTRIARRRDPACVDLYMDEAANLRLLGLWDDAAQLYQDVLRIDRRPEIYFNLAVVELARGHRQEAVRNYTRAVMYNPVMIGDIDDEPIRDEVRLTYYPPRKR